jgi:PAS domain S-box-containing protein
MKHLPLKRFGTFFLLTSVLVAAYSNGSQATAPTDPRKVVLQLRWVHQFQFAGYYAAHWQGYYADEGLDVDIRSSARPDGTFIRAGDALAHGHAEFAIGGAEFLVANDVAPKFILAASIFQQSPVAIASRASSRVSSPRDLVGLKVLRGFGDMTDIELDAMLRAQSIPTEDLRSPEFARSDMANSFSLLLEGRIDAYACYTLTCLWKARETGLDVTLLRPSTYGIDFYGDSLFTTRAFAAAEPETVARFVRASLKGWAYALEHPVEVAERIVREFDRKDPDGNRLAINLFQAEEVRRLMMYPVVDLGHTNPDRWHRMHRTLHQTGLVKREFDRASFIFSPPTPQSARMKMIHRALFITVIAVAIVAGGLGLACLLFRHRVRQRTRELEDEAARRKEEEQRLRHVFDSMFAFVSLFDLDGKLLEANRAPLERARLLSDDVIGEPFWSTPWWQHSELEQRRIRSAIESAAAGVMSRADYTVRLADEEIITIDAIFAPIYARDGSVSEVIGFGVDITERKNAEADVERERDFVSDLIETAPVIILLIDEKGCVRHANRRFMELTGYVPSDFLGRDWVETFIPERERRRIRSLLADTFDGMSVFGNVNPVLKRDGSELLVEWYGRTSSTRYGEASLLAIGLDVTEREENQRLLAQSEKRLRRAQRTSRIGSWEWNFDTGVQDWSKELYPMFAMDPSVDRLRYPDFLESLSADNRAAMEKAIGATSRPGRAERFELRIPSGDGGARTIAGHADPLQDADGRITGITVTFQDITEQRRMEERLQQVRKLEALGRLTGSITHDFNNLIGVIMGNAALLQDRLRTDAESMKLIDKILDAVSTSRSLTQELLAFSGQQTLKPVVLDPADLIASVLSMVDRVLPDTVSVVAEIRPDVRTCFADESQLKSALLNLVLNSKDALPEGGIICLSAKTVTVKSASDDLTLYPGEYVRFTVSDDGVGIPPAILGRVTEPFFTTKPLGEGTGLGLSTVEGFAHQSGGTMTVKSVVNRGTEVSIYLPTVAPERSERAGGAEGEAETTLAGHR